MSAPAPRRRFTADEVLRMVEVGILEEDEPVELLEGELVEMSPQGPAHHGLKFRLRRLLEEAYAEHMVLDEGPLVLDVDTIPEPDLAVVGGTPDALMQAHPTGQDALLVVEIAVSSQATDRWKAGLYAKGGVPVYWLIDVPARTVTVYTAPEDGRYAQVSVRHEDEGVALPGLTLQWDVRALLP